MGYRILDHTADIGIEVHGSTLTDLFSQAALALVDLLTDRTILTGEAERIIRVAGADLEDLWVNYLREILFLFHGDNFLVKGVRSIACEKSPSPNPILTPTLPGEGREANMVTGLSLVAHCFGDIYHSRHHVLKTEIKAVTYHRAEVKQTPAGWRGVFIVDV
jgi:SHS2 domain-containing protein